MSSKRNTCGNCTFAKPAGAFHPNKVMCTFGGSERGPFSRGLSACITHRVKEHEVARNLQAIQIKEDIFRSREQSGSTKKVAVYRPLKEDHISFPEEQLPKLREYYFNFANLTDIAKYFHVPRKVIQFTIQQQGWHRSKSTSSTKPYDIIEREREPVVPIDQLQYANVRPCKGQCCKYKLHCQHHLSWQEQGRPEFGCISSISSCINGSSEKRSSHPFYLFLPLAGEDIGNITFAETCD